MNLGKNEAIIARYKDKDEARRVVQESMVNGILPYENSFLDEKEDFKNSLKSNCSKFSKVKKFYTYVDAINSNIEKFTVCQKGCAFCCKIPVTITKLEAEYIEKNTNHKIKDIKNINVNDYCPFLEQTKGVCSIYEYRPIACRTFFALDNPKYCENGKEEHMLFQLNSSPELLNMSNELFINTKTINTNDINLLNSFKDIRNYFSRE